MKRNTISEQLKSMAPIVVVILVGMVILMATQKSALSQVCPDGKVPICHKPGTPEEKEKCVPPQAAQDHIDHGDRAGLCQLPGICFRCRTQEFNANPQGCPELNPFTNKLCVSDCPSQCPHQVTNCEFFLAGSITIHECDVQTCSPHPTHLSHICGF